MWQSYRELKRGNFLRHSVLSVALFLGYIVYHCSMNFAASYIDRNRVIPAGHSRDFYCYSSHAPVYWHFYSLTPASKPCGFGNHSLYRGISRCPSASRFELSYGKPSSWRSVMRLRIKSVQLSDAGVYTCGGHNPYDRSTTASAIVGILGKGVRPFAIK